MTLVVMNETIGAEPSASFTSVLSRSWGSTRYAEAHKPSTAPIASQPLLTLPDADYEHQNVTKEASNSISVLTKTNSISLCDSNGIRHHVILEKSAYDRLYASCHARDLPWLHNYIRNKWECLRNIRYPFIISPDFYLLWKETCGVTHELFADSVNASGVLSHFCSADTADKKFGACGSWEDVEDLVDGGVGHPPFDNEFLKKLLIRMETNVRKNRAYCRVLVLPYNKNGVLRRVIDSERSEFEGVVLAVIDKGLLRFRHQEDLFESRSNPSNSSELPFRSNMSGRNRKDKSNLRDSTQHQCQKSKEEAVQVSVDQNASDADWICESPFAIVIWINENYRNKYPAPCDVEDIFLNWAVSNFGAAADNVVDMDAIDMVFPDRTRSGERKADLFAL